MLLLLHAAGLLHRPLLLPPPPGRRSWSRGSASRGRADVHRRAACRRTATCRAARAPTARCSSTPATRRERLLAAIDELGVELEAILLTHTHFDHVGAVAPVARATGAPGLLPASSRCRCSRDIDDLLPAGFGPVRVLGGRGAARRRRAPAARGLRHRRHLHARPQPRPRHLRDRRRRCSPATCCSRARSAAPTCPAATTRR